MDDTKSPEEQVLMAPKKPRKPRPSELAARATKKKKKKKARRARKAHKATKKKVKRPKVVKTKRKPGKPKVKPKVKPATVERSERLDFRLSKTEKARLTAKAKKLRRTVTSIVLEAVEKIR